MSKALTDLLDPYTRKARLEPVLWSLLPIFVLFVLLTPEFQTPWTVAGWLVIGCGGATFLSQVGRGRGKKLQPVLFRLWGGKPSVAMLRHRDTRLPTATKTRYRDFLARTVPGLQLASPDDESKSPEQADDGYESATSWLLTQTRDREKFGLLFQENINYGFRRNVWGLKPWALTSGPIAMAFVWAFKYDVWTGEIVTTLSIIDLPVSICVAAAIVHLLVFVLIIRKGWVRVAADAYARQLLATCDVLEEQRHS